MFFKLPACVRDTREERACPCSAPAWVGCPVISIFGCKVSDFRVNPTAEPKSSGSDLSWLAGVSPLLLPLLILVGRHSSWHVRRPCWVHAAWRAWSLPTCENVGQSQRGGRLSCKTENSPRQDREDGGDPDMRKPWCYKKRTNKHKQKIIYKKGDEQSEQVHLGSYYTMDNGNVQPSSIRSKARMCLEVITNLR